MQPAPDSLPEPSPTPRAVEPPQFSDPETPQQKRLEFGDIPWKSVSPRLIPLRQIGNVISTLIWTAVVSVPLILKLVDVWPHLWGWLAWLLPAAFLIEGVVRVFIIPRQVRALGYAEREDDLLLKEGILFRNVTAIPYGRLQYLDVSDGPLQRAFKVRTLEIKTASSSTSGQIQGIPPEEAERLREQLTARGQARLAGL